MNYDIEDFNELCETMGMDPDAKKLIEMGFKNKGLIIDSYKEDIHSK